MSASLDSPAPADDTPYAALFPGQGSQQPDMRDAVQEHAPELLQTCIDLVGEDPFERADENTRFAQPAIFLAALVGYDALLQTKGSAPLAAAGHSLGELAALAAAQAIERHRALELVVLRGRLMGEADNGSMLALVGATVEEAHEIAAAAGVTVANDNAPGQVVLSGALDALDRAQQEADTRGRRTIALNVAGAFHSPLMADAVEPFATALAATPFEEPAFPVLCGATAQPFTDPRTQLATALTSPVRWRETVLALHALGADAFAETGPGQVLTRMNKRILKEAPSRV